MRNLAASLRATVLPFCAVLASFLLTYALCLRAGMGPSPAILSAALAVGLARQAERFSARALLLKLVTLPLAALAAALLGAALLRAPVAGAALFTLAIAASIQLRSMGKSGAAAGRAIALPAITMLIVPVPVDAGNGWVAVALVLAAGAIAFLCTAAVAAIAQSVHEPPFVPDRKPRDGDEPRLSVPARMALQMLAALALAFAVGMTFFHLHWPWVVLTAFIVCSGAIGRGDAIYKGLLRLGGAIAGTLAAALVAAIAFPNAAAYAAAAFAALFAGMWLRNVNYAYWAACATLLFALLQDVHGPAALALFGARVVAIVAGALCAIAATWFVFPIRTGNVVRRRVADALGAVREVLGDEAGGDPARRAALLAHHAAQLDRAAPPVRLHRAVFASRGAAPDHPAALIDRTHALLRQAGEPDVDRVKAGGELRSLAAILRAGRG